MRFSTVIAASLLSAVVSANMGNPVKRFVPSKFGKRDATTVCTSNAANGATIYTACDSTEQCNTANDCCCTKGVTNCVCPQTCPANNDGSPGSGWKCIVGPKGQTMYVATDQEAGIVGAMSAAAQVSSVGSQATSAINSIVAGASSEVSSLQAAATSAEAAVSSAASSASAAATSGASAAAATGATTTGAQPSSPTMAEGSAPKLAVGAPALVLAIFAGIMML